MKKPWSVAMLVLGAVACDETPETEHAAQTAQAAPRPPLPGARNACVDPLPPGQHRGQVILQGLVPRVFDLNVPPGAGPMPVVLVLHPLTQNREWGKLAAGMVSRSNAEGFIAVFPDGLLGSWNAGTCCGHAALTGVDDVGFIRAVLARVEALTCMDPGRVYATGLSNGAFLAHRLACEASDVITAVAPVAGVLGLPDADCRPTRPVPVLQIHGTADPLVPFGGGPLGPSVPDTVAAWARRDGCTAEVTETFNRGAARCTAQRSCAGGAEVEVCTIAEGGHCWFGEPVCFVGKNPRDLDASDAVWGFLSRFWM